MSTKTSAMPAVSSTAMSDMDTSISPSSPISSGLQSWAVGEEEHPKYAFYDGSLMFQLEGLKYRIHGSLLTRHCAFTSTWATDLRDPAAVGIKRADLEAFLSMIYLATYETFGLDLPVEDWISILRLATRWKAEGMRILAINMLTTKAPALDRLILCRTYDVLSWLAPACAALALRPTALTMAEAEKLVKSDIVRIFLAREALSKGDIDATEPAVSSWLAQFASAPLPPPSPPPPTIDGQPISQAPGPDPIESKTKVSETPSSEVQPTVMTSAEASESVQTKVPQPLLSSAVAAGAVSDNTSSAAGLSLPAGPAALPQAAGPLPARPSEDKQVNEFVSAIRAKRYDYAFALSWNKNQVDPVAQQVASSLVNADGTVSHKDLHSLSRAVIRRAVKQSKFIPVASQLLAALSSRLPQGIKFESLLQDDMQSLSSRWSAFRAGATPAVDHGGIMDDLATQSREIYQQQMGNGKGLFRSLVRLGVLPESDQWVSMLVKQTPFVHGAP
ncbi:hypothetical protein PENSPDRAFT_747712 [Peniophora sp. CONT]|nr:hypothetical protein PENSPDRAFT_747712 [Peniophora sp. CONT]